MLPITSLLATFPASVAMCLAVGLVMGTPASRIQGPYLAVAALAMAGQPSERVGQRHPPLAVQRHGLRRQRRVRRARRLDADAQPPFASEAQFGTSVAIFLVVGLVVGGTGSIAGAVPGAFVYFFVPYFVSEWTYDQSGMPPGPREVRSPISSWLRPAGPTVSGLLFGVALLVLMVVLPGGFVDGARRARARLVCVEREPPWLADVHHQVEHEALRPAGAAGPTTVP